MSFVVRNNGTSPRTGSGCLVAFGAAFALAGAIALIASFRQSGLNVGLFVGGLFLLAGVGVILAGVFARRSARRDAALRAEHPDAPWRWRKDWARAEIPSGNGKQTAILWFAAVFWNGVSLPLTFVIRTEAAKGNPWLWLFLLFPVIGLFLLLGAISQTRRWLRYGRCVLKLDDVCGHRGGFLRGRVQLGRPVVPTGDPVLRLVCQEVASDSDESPSARTHWETEVLLDRVRLPTGPLQEIPVHLAIDPLAPTSGEGTDRGTIAWKLFLHIPSAGPELRLEFEVPVFARPEEAATPAFARFALDGPSPGSASPAREIDAGRAIAEARLRWFENPATGAATLEFPSGRTRGAAIATGLATLGCTGLVLAGLLLGWPILLVLVIAFFAAVLGAIAHTLAFDGSTIRIEGDAVIVRWARPFGWKERRVSRRDVAACPTKSSMSSGTTEWFSLELVGHALSSGARAPKGAEPLAVRRLRRQALRAAAHAPARATELRRELEQQPAFRFTIGTGIRGFTAARQIARFLEARLRGGSGVS